MITLINNSIISFKKIPLKIKNDLTYAPGYTIERKGESDVFIKSDLDYGNNFFVTKITDKNDDIIAINHFSIKKDERKIETCAMNILPKTEKGKGLGTVMHLDRIIDLLENDLDEIVLYSTGEAALFHGKMNFEPDLQDRDDIESALFSISKKDYTKFPQIKNTVQKANSFINSTEYMSIQNTLKKPNVKIANKIVSEYIKAVNPLKLTPEHRALLRFSEGFNMILRKKDIIKNKNFYNLLFQKFNIDYKIE